MSKIRADFVFDAGALIAVERARPRLTALIKRIDTQGGEIIVPVSALAQVHRGAKQTLLHRLLKLRNVREVALSPSHARAIGVLLATSGTSDVVDAHVMIVAHELRYPVVTSDPDDLYKLNETIPLIVV